MDEYGWDQGEFPDSLDVGELIADLKKITMRRNNKVSTLRTSQVRYDINLVCSIKSNSVILYPFLFHFFLS